MNSTPKQVVIPDYIFVNKTVQLVQSIKGLVWSRYLILHTSNIHRLLKRSLVA